MTPRHVRAPRHVRTPQDVRVQVWGLRKVRNDVTAAVLDRALSRAIARAGRPNGIWFTERQLYYELGRVLLPSVPSRLGAFALPVPVDYPTFRAALDRRGREHVPGLLPHVVPADVAPAGQPVPESDLLVDYGLPRLLVCQHVEVARMLLANDVHLETATPVLSEADVAARPQVVGAVIEALAATGGATVYVLHDASAAGVRVPGRVRERLAAFADGKPGVVRLVAAGLRPRDARALNLAAARPHVPMDSGETEQRMRLRDASTTTPDGLDPWEVRWLARGRAAEVAAVPPDRLLRGVHRVLRGRSRNRWSPPDLRAARELGFLTWPAA